MLHSSSGITQPFFLKELIAIADESTNEHFKARISVADILLTAWLTSNRNGIIETLKNLLSTWSMHIMLRWGDLQPMLKTCITRSSG